MSQPQVTATSSLRTKFILYTAAVALVIFSLGVAAVVSVHLSTRALDEAIEDAIKEQYPVLRIEKLVQRAEMQAHDLLMYGDDLHRERYRESSTEVDRAFGDLLHAPFDVAEERIYAREALGRWNTVTSRILDYAEKARGADALSEMEYYDGEIAGVLNSLGSLKDQISREIEGSLSDAYGVKMRLVFLVATLFLLCLGVVILLGVLTARSVLGPVRRLTDGVLRIGQGDYSSRVPVVGSDEVAVLGHAFNGMAERLEQDRNLIERLTVRDGQTGLYNRKFFESMIEDELQMARRNGGVFSVIRMDIREFDNIRADQPEHVLSGVLQSTASVVAENIRMVDRGAYLGNGRFGIILRSTSETGARIKADALRARIASVSISPPHPPFVYLDLRMGIAAFNMDTETVEELLRKTEADMEKPE